jgi:signal transduction histidine kinase
MRRARILAAVVAPWIVWALFAPAAYADVCDDVSGSSPGLGSTLDNTLSSLNLLCTRDDPTPTPTATPTPTPTSTTTTQPSAEPTSGPGRTAAAPGGTQPTTTPVERPVATSTPPPSIEPGRTIDPPAAGSSSTGDEPGTVLTVAPVARRIPVGPLAIASVFSAAIAGLAGHAAGRKRTGARATRDADARVGAVLGLVPDGVIVADADARIRMINGVAAELLELSPERARGMQVWEVLRGTEARGEWLPAWLRTNADTSAATTATLEGEARMPIGVATSPVRSGKRGLGTVLVVRDLRRERALERMKSEFLANVGHELRTPLTSALGFARILRERELSTTQRDAFVNAIVDACLKLSRVVDLLIDVASIEGGGFAADGDRIDAGELLRAAAHAWQAQAPEHVFAERIPQRRPRIAGNASLLRHAIDELIDNAIKFSPGGGVVTLGTSVRESDGARAIELTVSDQGIGIPPEQFDELFEDFRQGDGSSTRDFGGLGLGLAFVRRVAALHGGSVRVTSTPGEGSTFTMCIPIRQVLDVTDRAGASKPRARSTGSRR